MPKFKLLLGNFNINSTITLIVWLTLTLPLVGLGYGADVDSWIVAENGEQIWETKSYQKSRSMGFPLHELISAPLVHFGGWITSNIASLIAGFTFLGAVWKLGRMDHLRHPSLTFLITAFHPIIIISSTTTMDYIWAVSPLSWAYVMILNNKPASSGALIGIATGFRPTSVIFCVPAILWFLWIGKWKSAGIVTLTTVAVSLLTLSPLLIALGLPTDLDAAQFPSELNLKDLVLLTGFKLTFALGILQTIWLFSLVIFICWGQWHNNQKTSPNSNPELRFHLAVIIMYLALFLALPMEAEYLMPAFLSLILICDRFLSVRLMTITVVILLSYHILRLDLLGGESGYRKIEATIKPGYTIAHVQQRKHMLSTREIASDYQATNKTILLYGRRWIPLQNSRWAISTDIDLPCQINGSLCLSFQTVDLNILKKWSEDGYRIVAWNDRKSYLVRSGSAWRNYVEIIDLDQFFGKSVNGSLFQ